MNFQHSEQLDKLAADLSLLQGELPHVGKDSKGYGYNYADLASTLDVVKPLLLKYGFSIYQFGGDNGGPNATLVTMLLHKSGQYIKGTMELIDMEMKGTNAAQNRGSVLSYFRRYSVQAILGMASEDSDAASKSASNNSSFSKPAAVGNSVTVTTSENKPVAAQAPQAAPVASRGGFRRTSTSQAGAQ